jgi:hypothetical protein
MIFHFCFTFIKGSLVKTYDVQEIPNKSPICNNRLKGKLEHKDDKDESAIRKSPQLMNNFENKKLLPLRSEKYTQEISVLVVEANKLSLKGKTLCCNFCRNNNESEVVYKSHNRTDVSGKIICPILANHQCEVCGVYAHTRNYCELYKRQTKFKQIQKYALNKNL